MKTYENSTTIYKDGDKIQYIKTGSPKWRPFDTKPESSFALEVLEYMQLHNQDEVGQESPWNYEDAEYHLLLSDKYHNNPPKDLSEVKLTREEIQNIVDNFGLDFADQYDAYEVDTEQQFIHNMYNEEFVYQVLFWWDFLDEGVSMGFADKYFPGESLSDEQKMYIFLAENRK